MLEIESVDKMQLSKAISRSRAKLEFNTVVLAPCCLTEQLKVHLAGLDSICGHRWARLGGGLRTSWLGGGGSDSGTRANEAANVYVASGIGSHCIGSWFSANCANASQNTSLVHESTFIGQLTSSPFDILVNKPFSDRDGSKMASCSEGESVWQGSIWTWLEKEKLGCQAKAEWEVTECVTKLMAKWHHGSH